jgi:hypothetical protein
MSNARLDTTGFDEHVRASPTESHSFDGGFPRLERPLSVRPNEQMTFRGAEDVPLKA